jgi:hypothetical protein
MPNEKYGIIEKQYIPNLIADVREANRAWSMCKNNNWLRDKALVNLKRQSMSKSEQSKHHV